MGESGRFPMLEEESAGSDLDSADGVILSQVTLVKASLRGHTHKQPLNMWERIDGLSK